MPIFRPKERTAETYLAGIGASGALMASAFVMFVILVGVVTFDAWPRAGHLLGGTDGDVGLKSVANPVVTPQPSNSSPNRSARSSGVTTQFVAPRQVGHSTRIHTGGGLSGGTTSPGPSGGVQAPGEPPAPPPEPPTQEATSVVRGAVSSVGNGVEGTTNFVGDALGGSSSPGLGGVVGGLGQTVNGTVQGLVGGSK